MDVTPIDDSARPARIVNASARLQSLGSLCRKPAREHLASDHANAALAGARYHDVQSLRVQETQANLNRSNARQLQAGQSMLGFVARHAPITNFALLL